MFAKHHQAWAAHWYREPLASSGVDPDLARAFRGLPCLQVWVYEPVHWQLHPSGVPQYPPKVPLNETMKAVLRLHVSRRCPFAHCPFRLYETRIDQIDLPAGQRALLAEFEEEHWELQGSYAMDYVRAQREHRSATAPDHFVLVEKRPGGIANEPVDQLVRPGHVRRIHEESQFRITTMLALAA